MPGRLNYIIILCIRALRARFFLIAMITHPGGFHTQPAHGPQAPAAPLCLLRIPWDYPVGSSSPSWTPCPGCSLASWPCLLSALTGSLKGPGPGSSLAVSGTAENPVSSSGSPAVFEACGMVLHPQGHCPCWGHPHPLAPAAPRH